MRRPVRGLLLAALFPALAPPASVAAQRGEPAPALEPISAVRVDADGDFSPDRLGERVRVRGVLASAPGTLDRKKHVGFLVDEKSGMGLYAREGQLASMRPGDWLQVVGRVGTFNGLEQILVERVEKLGSQRIPEPTPASVGTLIGERMSGRLVRVRGVLRVRSEEGRETRFALADGDALLPLYAPEPIHSAPGFPLSEEDVGRKVEVVGFATQFDREPPYTSGYQLVPRSASDVRVTGISRTAVQRALGALLTLAVIAAGLAYHRRAARLNRESTTDPMTGLRNRRGYDAALRERISAAEREGSPLALVVLDLDNFKEANDRYGHLVGDAVLRRTAQVLLESVREADIVCRFGGDEFAIILPGVAGSSLMRVAERIVHRLRTVRVEVDGQALELVLGASAGVALYGGECTGPDELFHAADSALYQSKREGKGMARFAIRVAS